MRYPTWPSVVMAAKEERLFQQESDYCGYSEVRVEPNEPSCPIPPTDLRRIEISVAITPRQREATEYVVEGDHVLGSKVQATRARQVRISGERYQCIGTSPAESDAEKLCLAPTVDPQCLDRPSTHEEESSEEPHSRYRCKLDSTGRRLPRLVVASTLLLGRFLLDGNIS